MANDDRRDEQMIRFLTGDVSTEEREEIETRMLEDVAFHEQLCALEGELLLSFAQGRLDEPLRRRLAARLAASPALRRQFEEIMAIEAAVSRMPAPATQRSPIHWLAWAAVLAIALVGGWLFLRHEGLATPPPPVIARNAPVGGGGEADSIFRFELLPDGGRTLTEPQANVLRIPSGTRVVELTARLKEDAIVNPSATLKPPEKGAAAIYVSRDVRVSPRAGMVDVSVRVPASLLPVGDYLLTISGESKGRPFDIATRFFSVTP